MELILVAVLGGVVLALALWKVIWIVVSQAVDNLLTWAIFTFGNDEAVKRQKEDDE